jgi:hypothetical protein
VSSHTLSGGKGKGRGASSGKGRNGKAAGAAPRLLEFKSKVTLLMKELKVVRRRFPGNKVRGAPGSAVTLSAAA